MISEETRIDGQKTHMYKEETSAAAAAATFDSMGMSVESKKKKRREEEHESSSRERAPKRAERVIAFGKFETPRSVFDN